MAPGDGAVLAEALRACALARGACHDPSLAGAVSRRERVASVRCEELEVAEGELQVALEDEDGHGRALGHPQVERSLALVDDVDLPPPAPGAAPIKSVDPSADLTVPPAVSLVVVEVRDQRGRGGLNFGYRLTIEPAVADFIVQQPTSELNVPRVGSATLAVPVTRRGYTGPIRLTVPDLPPGLYTLVLQVEDRGTTPARTVKGSLDFRVTNFPGQGS